MSAIRQFMVHGFDPEIGGSDGIEWYFKFEDDEEHVLCNLCVAGDGIYHYSEDSHVFSNPANATYKFLSTENLNNLFKNLGKIEGFGDGADISLDISFENDTIMIKKGGE